jgi:DNA-binding PadR family transcriptional regulator
MALEHALLVALSERPASGLELTRRFEKSLGFFWHATHQQIYRVLARMEADGWVAVEVVAQEGRPDKRVHTPSAEGRRVLAEWLATAMPMETFRSELAVKLRGASYGDRATLLAHLVDTRADHAARLAHYEALEREQFPDPAGLDDAGRDRWLVLRGGIRLEHFWIDWITEYLHAHDRADEKD